MNTPDRRMRVLLFLRLGSVIWALLSAGFAAAVLILRTINNYGFELWPYGMPIVFVFCACIAPAAIVAWCSQRLANWMVPLGKCPHCGYSISHDATRCSECGTDLSTRR